MGAKAEHFKGFGPSDIQAAVAPRLIQPLPAAAYALLARYVQLLTHWNQKINLTAVRDPQVLVRLHLAECLRAAQRIRGDIETLLDLGSGAGLPGIPIQIARPELRVTLAESPKEKGGVSARGGARTGLAWHVGSRRPGREDAGGHCIRYGDAASRRQDGRGHASRTSTHPATARRSRRRLPGADIAIRGGNHSS